LGFCLAYRFLADGRAGLAGVVLGLSMFKLQIALPLALFLLVRYASVTFFSGVAAGIGLAGALSIAVTGWGVLLSFGRVLKLTTAATLAPGSSAVLAVAPLAMPNLKGLISGITLNRSPGRALFATTILLSLLIAIVVVRRLWAAKPLLDGSFSIALTAALVLSYYLHMQDLTVLLLPLGLMAGNRNRNFALATWLLYIAPPFVVMLGHNLIFLLSLPLILLLLGTMQVAGNNSAHHMSPAVSA
jgi:hypothetical protein